MATKKVENIEFEAAMVRINEIVAKLEDKNLKLDDSLALYEEGISLVAVCKNRLDEAEKRISILLPDENGEIIEKPFSVPEAE